LPNSTIALVIPPIFPVNVGLLIGAFNDKPLSNTYKELTKMVIITNV